MPNKSDWSGFVVVAVMAAGLALSESSGLAQENLGRIGLVGLTAEPPSTITDTAEPLPDDAQALMTAFDGEAMAIRQKAELEIQAKQVLVIKALQVLQDNYTREAKLDEAIAIRDKIRQLKVSHLKPQPNPGNLTRYYNQIGDSFHFEVVGRVGGPIWGSEVYTCDSDLATAVVHAGVLKVGQKGIVKVTMVKSSDMHQASTQNGVNSQSYGPFPASYTVQLAREKDAADSAKTAEPKAVPR